MVLRGMQRSSGCQNPRRESGDVVWSGEGELTFFRSFVCSFGVFQCQIKLRTSTGKNTGHLEMDRDHFPQGPIQKTHLVFTNMTLSRLHRLISLP